MNTESHTPTPRTDALMPDQGHKRTIYEHIQVMETHARQLERELAEVNEKLRQHASMLKSSDAHNNDMFCKLEKERELHSETKRELAEVTKQRDHYKKACNQYSEDEMLCKLQEVTKQRDALAEALRNYMSHHRRYGFVTLNEVLDAEQALRATKGGSYDS